MKKVVGSGGELAFDFGGSVVVVGFVLCFLVVVGR